MKVVEAIEYFEKILVPMTEQSTDLSSLSNPVAKDALKSGIKIIEAIYSRAGCSVDLSAAYEQPISTVLMGDLIKHLHAASNLMMIKFNEEQQHQIGTDEGYEQAKKNIVTEFGLDTWRGRMLDLMFLMTRGELEKAEVALKLLDPFLQNEPEKAQVETFLHTKAMGEQIASITAFRGYIQQCLTPAAVPATTAPPPSAYNPR